MKKLCMSVLGVILMIGMFGSTPANATLITNVAPTDSTLTIVFGAPAEFDAVPAATVEMSNSSIASLKVTNDNTPSQQPGTAAVPEPSTLMLVGLGVLGLVGLARRKKH